MQRRRKTCAGIICVLCAVMLFLSACGGKETTPDSAETPEATATPATTPTPAPTPTPTPEPTPETTLEIPDGYSEYTIVAHQSMINVSFYRPDLLGWEDINRSKIEHPDTSWRLTGDINDSSVAMYMINIYTAGIEDAASRTTAGNDEEDIDYNGFKGKLRYSSTSWRYTIDAGPYGDEGRIIIDVSIGGGSGGFEEIPEIIEMDKVFFETLKVTTDYNGDDTWSGYTYDMTKTVKIATPIEFNGQQLEVKRQHIDGFGLQAIVEYIDAEKDMKLIAVFDTPNTKAPYEANGDKGFTPIEFGGYPGYEKLSASFNGTTYYVEFDVNGMYYSMRVEMKPASDSMSFGDFLEAIKMEASPHVEIAKELLVTLWENCTLEELPAEWFEIRN